MNAFVLPDQHASSERLAANETTVRLFPGMRPNVLLQSKTFPILSSAYVAFVRLFLSMTFHVALQHAVRNERLGAQFALNLRVARVLLSPVLVQFGHRVKCIVTYRADTWVAGRMRFGMLHRTFAIDGDKAAHVAR